jgi:hypothetical protein
MGDKVKIINLFKKGESGKNTAEKYDTGMSTTSYIQKNSESILNFLSVFESEDGITIRKP